MQTDNHAQIAETLAFPVFHRVAEVRRAAEILHQTHGEAAVSYWKTLVRSIADPLIAAGIHMEDVRQQIFAFQDAVQAEMQTLG